MVYSFDRSKTVVPELVLLFVFVLYGLFYEVICYKSCLDVIMFLCFFSSLDISITSPGKERANLSAFRTFVRFVLVWFCLVPLPLGVREGLRLVIVALWC